MNDIAKKSIQDKIQKALEVENIRPSVLAKTLDINPSYVSMMLNEKFWPKCTSKAWEAALAWINSGQKISEYALKHGKTMPAPVMKEAAVKVKGEEYVPEVKTQLKEEAKKPASEPAVTSKVKIDIEINLIINGKKIAL